MCRYMYEHTGRFVVLKMKIEQQIEKLKGHAVAFVDELEWIIQCFKMLEPAIRNRALIGEVTRRKSTMGFRVLRRSVGRYCILGLTRLTYDQGPNNPTAGNFIEALVCSYHGADQLRERLKADFARPIHAGEVPGFPPSE